MTRATPIERTYSTPEANTRPRWQNYALWALQVLVALAFLAAGGQKLLGVPAMIGLFETIGLGQWFRYLTGGLEVLGALLLLLPNRAWIGAALLACIMVGAVATHLFVIGGSAVPALVLLALTLVIAWFRRSGYGTTAR